MIYKDFFFDSYNDSGWIPVHPFGTQAELGDVFQIHQGRMLTLLNAGCDLDLVNHIHANEPFTLRQDDWRHARACLKVDDSLVVEQQFEEQLIKRQQTFRFSAPGGYLFYGDDPSATYMRNWSQLAPELIVKLTQSKYTFRQAYVVTAVARMYRWGLAVAATDGAELMLEGEREHSRCLFEQQHCNITNSSGLAFFEHNNERPIYFFKAKKLTISDRKFDEYLYDLYKRGTFKPQLPIDNWLHANLLSLATTEQLNINTCQDFFQWQDATLDDVLLLTQTQR
ncbi:MULTISPECIES: hypothetical protein [Pseudoalteromonas]|uniref:Uncharacterized protein n=1 Tax=Pseudoalteromonas amylolytica TaxID=1859457 RepID=A0A1S1MNW0_9GAMM|nr:MULTISPECIES: hypothetical protein [Pseudoalteromonas]OHU84953.1 hypothetical protein BFC16_19890 [Pseudoalteromonas sp. JW3]OHU90096.1 hypothetical protein BET10_15085 [Pseudoalteromonas amylolytica]